MSLKKKKWIVLASVLFCIALSFYLSVIRFSSTNIENIIKDREMLSFSVKNDWVPMEKGDIFFDGETYATVQCKEPVYVQNILISGKMEGDFVTVKLSYASSGDKLDTLQSLDVPIELKNDDIYIEVEALVTEIKVELQQESGDGIKEIDEITLNPQKINVNIQALLLYFLFSLSLILLVIEILCDKDGFCKMATSLKKYRSLLVDLVSRDIKTKYRRSVLGILWSVLNPLLMMLVLTAVFSNIFRFEIQDFPVYYLTGYIMFNFMSEATNFSMMSIVGATGLIKKVYIPRIVFPLEKCLFALVNFGFSLIAVVIVFFIVGVQLTWTMILFFIPVIYLFIFNFGFGLILTTLNTFFRDMGYIYNVFVTLWVYLTPIIYPITALPEWMRSIVRLNPLYHYVEYFRAVTLYGTIPSLGDNLICLAYSLIFLFLGVMIFQKNQNKFIFYV